MEPDFRQAPFSPSLTITHIFFKYINCIIVLSAESMYIYASKKHVLQVKDTVTDFLRASLVPELCSDISAGTAGNGHLILIVVSAVRALPDQLTGLILDDLDLAIVTTTLTVIALRV